MPCRGAVGPLAKARAVGKRKEIDGARTPQPTKNAARAERLAVALRENLRKRKEQARARRSSGADRREGD
jgi:hypothetical protein